MSDNSAKTWNRHTGVNVAYTCAYMFVMTCFFKKKKPG